MVTNNTNQFQYLEYKNHEAWFSDLNSNLQSCRKAGEMMLVDVNNINFFYNKIKILKSAYSSYFGDNNVKINELLTEVENEIRTPAFVVSLNRYNQLNAEKKAEFSGMLWANIDKLLKIFELINEELKREELTPKPKTKKSYNPNNAILNN
jgi:hypothetical protein